jgi:crotonobetainyl-CoA:carnitine CoA-transferase CaiB-like acyl-CoA transferase
VAYWIDELARIGVPCSPINSLEQLLAHPHMAASGMILDYQHPLAGPTKGVGQPILLNDVPRTAGKPPPTLGQHTDEILAELGLTNARIDELRKTNVVA